MVRNNSRRLLKSRIKQIAKLTEEAYQDVIDNADLTEYENEQLVENVTNKKMEHIYREIEIYLATNIGKKIGYKTKE